MTTTHFSPEETKQLVAELFEAKCRDEGRLSIGVDSDGQLVYQFRSNELPRLLAEFAAYYDNFFEGETS